MRRLQIIAGGSSLLVVLLASRVPQGLYSDPALQLKSVQQRLQGESPSINVWTHPDRRDISHDVAEWLMWWTPGTELVAFPLMRTGLSLATSVRIVAALSLVVGSIGWMTWFTLFGIPETALVATAIAWPFVRYASNSLFLYSYEMLVFAVAPWLLLAAHAFMVRKSRRNSDRALAFVVGVFLGAAYWLKDSTAFVAAGAVIAIARNERKQEGRVANRWLLTAASCAFGAALPFAILTVVNRLAGSAAGNKLTAALSVHPHLRTVADAVSFPALGLADADALWRYLLLHPTQGITHNSAWLSVVGLPGGLVLLALLVRPTIDGAAASLARWVLFVSIAALMLIWTISLSVTHEARHLAAGAFAVLPLAIAEGRRRWTASRPVFRRALALTAVFYVCVPLAYGVTSVLAKIWRFPAGYAPGPSGIYNALLAPIDIPSVRRTLLSRVDTARDVWYLTDPISALDLPGRAIIIHADFEPLEDLQGDRFMSSRDIRVHALLPARFEASGKGPVIRASFPQADRWTRSDVPDCECVLWSADLITRHEARVR